MTVSTPVARVSRLQDGLKLAAAFAITMGAATLGSLATGPNIPGWYASLAKPVFTPPNWAFPLAWTILFTLMAITLWRIWRRAASPERNRALAWFAVQLVLNVSWSVVFFGLRSPLGGLVVIVPFLATIVATCVATARFDRLAAALLVPYVAWVAFAAVLNVAIVQLN